MGAPAAREEGERLVLQSLSGRQVRDPATILLVQLAGNLAAEGAARHWPRPGDAGRVDAIADESSHRDAAVLQLGMAQEANRGLVRVAPELAVGEFEWMLPADEPTAVVSNAKRAKTKR